MDGEEGGATDSSVSTWTDRGEAEEAGTAFGDSTGEGAGPQEQNRLRENKTTGPKIRFLGRESPWDTRPT